MNSVEKRGSSKRKKKAVKRRTQIVKNLQSSGSRCPCSLRFFPVVAPQLEPGQPGRMEAFLVGDPGVMGGEAIDELHGSLGLLAPLPGTVLPVRAGGGREGVDPGVPHLGRRIGLRPRRRRLRDEREQFGEARDCARRLAVVKVRALGVWDAGHPAPFRGAGVLAAR